MNSPWIEFVVINEIPTKIICFGSYDFESKPWRFPKLILMFSGNPGEIEYYNEFLSDLNLKLSIPVIGLSHSGHNRLPSHMKQRLNFSDSKFFGLESQISYKTIFIREFIDSSSRMIIVSHSIGGYISLELLDRFEDIRNRVI
ncbi:DUF2305 domain containing protein [Sarcoptes scabiei]|uniref:Lipid droplet-associated hydrolase n=1 Tax=Sarcoptes scabiei TaxID=52283 RepID=A0A132AAP2_SARSC|nr:DUF2305 domain containing protein [Sarcoptes scabiei]